MPSIRTALTYASGLFSSLLIAGSVLVCQHSGAAAATDAHKPPAASPAQPKKIANGPSWQALTTAQQLALVPLAGEWDSMDSSRKEKWIAIGNRYARMSPAEQTRIQTRMRDWVKLTPEQRRSVRQNYVSSKKLDANQKSAQWQQYLKLSDEQKAQLAKQKLSPVPATAISRARTKPKVLLPITPKPASAVAVAPATAPTAPIGSIMPPAVLPAPPVATPAAAPQPHK
ncbi:MAG: hemolysin activation/secretion protein [Herbaspirillum sp.]|nr:hemolysin activation/secretion protein [Herbaspirillum sp.]